MYEQTRTLGKLLNRPVQVLEPCSWSMGWDIFLRGLSCSHQGQVPVEKWTRSC